VTLLNYRPSFFGHTKGALLAYAASDRTIAIVEFPGGYIAEANGLTAR
jgi:hypothetical protein